MIDAPIGKGGMGEVFLVTDRDLRRQLAMKVLRREVGDDRAHRLHFVAEAQATSQLDHPGVPPVHDIGLTPDGRLYFTMKLVSGRTLREVLHDLTLKRREVQRTYNQHKLVTVLERVCEAVHFAHQKGVIHRDLKPENIMLGDYGEVHVMDWGLARVEGVTDEYEDLEGVETARTDAGLDTQHGAIKGTLPYMSPEQLRSEQLDRRSDVYALGCLLYEMLTLQAAFDPDDPDLVRKKQAGELIDVATRNPRRTVPEALAAISRKSMAVRREERHATAEELGRALRRWLDGRAEQERRHTEAERRGDEADTAYALTMIERYSGAPVPSQGKLVLRSEPAAEVTLYRFEEIDGVLTLVEERSLGRTPLGPVALEPGSYLCVLKQEGYRDTRYPVQIAREATWRGEVRLRTDVEIGDKFVYVPGGPFVYGEGGKTETRQLSDFAIQRYPVTFKEYVEYLETLDEEEAQQRMPQTPGDGPYVEKDEDGSYRILSILVEGPARQWSLERHGEDFEWRVPVVGISHDDAEAYCAWKTKETGREWRLPTEEEREKAARGVDGRRFAWGKLQDASLGKCRESRAVLSQPEPVGPFPSSESVYGMGDASGGVWDWTSSWEDARRSSRVLRGGSGNLRPIDLRCAARYGYLPRARNANVGFRCSRGL